MPVLRYSEAKGRHYIESVVDGENTEFRLTSEGIRFLMIDLGYDDDESFEAEVLTRLLDRRWAVPDDQPAGGIARSVPPETAANRPAPSTLDGDADPNKSQSRTRGRMVALQVLYQIEQNQGVPAVEIDKFISRRVRDARVREFTKSLVAGVRANQARIDALISGTAENWRLDRMAAIDRNILRLGAFELIASEVPAKVAINEALELAKRYSTAQSSRFVNGILDRLLAAEAAQAAKEKEKESDKEAATEPSQPESEAK